MERMQSLYWHLVDYDLSESGVTPMTIRDLLGPNADAEAFLQTALGYPLSEGSHEARANIAAWYPDAAPENVSLTNGGSEANHLTLWTLLEPGDRLAFMIPNYLQGWGLGRHYGKATDTFKLKLRDGRWQLDLDQLERAVTKKTKVVMVCNPNNPTGHVLTEDEMDAVIAAADRVGAWIVSDEIYRGAEVDSDVASPTFWGRYDKVIVTSGLSKAFAMPGLRVGWTLGPQELIEQTWSPPRLHDAGARDRSRTGSRRSRWIPWCARTSSRAPARSSARTSRSFEAWIHAQGDVFTYVRPVAGAIGYVKYHLPVRSTELVDRVRDERSVLLVPGDMFGLGKGIRYGFGFDIEHTMKGLAQAEDLLTGRVS